jgi:hypothetical protein
LNNTIQSENKYDLFVNYFIKKLFKMKQQYIKYLFLFFLSFTINLTAQSIESNDSSLLKPNKWSVGGAFHIAPFENYPALGFSVSTMYALKKYSLGAEIVYYLPQTIGNVKRNISLAHVYAQKNILSTENLNWVFEFGPGLGFFKDDFSELYNDATEVAPGFMVGTRVCYNKLKHLAPFVGFRSSVYFTNEITDDVWIEFTVGTVF